MARPPAPRLLRAGLPDAEPPTDAIGLAEVEWSDAEWVADDAAEEWAAPRAAGARVIEPEALKSSRAVDWRMPVRGVGTGIRVGLEALVFSWLAVVVPVVAGYVATATAPTLGQSSWGDAARAATAGWLLGLGEPLDIVTPATATSPETITQVTLVPLGLTALVGALLAGGVRRAGLSSLWGAGGVVAACGGALWLAYVAAGTAPTPRGLLTQAGVVLLALAFGMRRAFRLPRPASEPWRSVVEWLVAGVQAGVALVAALAVVGAGLALVSLLSSLGDVIAIHRALAPDLVSAVVLVLAQIAALATAVVWALAWLAGPGFAIGVVTVTPVAAAAGPLPALPVLAAVPDAGPGPGRWVAAVIVGVVALGLVRPLGRTRDWWGVAAVGGVAVVVVSGALGVAAALSGGSVGPLTPVGTGGLAVFGAVAIWAALGALLAVGGVLGLRRLECDPAAFGEPVLAAGRRLRRALTPRSRRAAR